MNRPARLAKRLLIIVLLAAAASWGTLHSPTIFFDNQVLLAPSLGVFALMQFGWAGLPVGLAAALTTLPLWGHPWAAVVLVLQLLWQLLFLRYANGGPSQVGNGRIVLATIVFWLCVGWPIKTLLYTKLLAVDPESTNALVVKEAVVSVVNAGLALVLFLAVQLLKVRRSHGDLSLRGLAFATQLLMISLPGVWIITAMGQQLTNYSLGQCRLSLAHQAEEISLLLPPDSPAIPPALLQRQAPKGLAFEAVAANGRRLRSDPALLSRLQQEFQPDPAPELAIDPQFNLLVARHDQPRLQQDLQGYWRFDLTIPSEQPSGWRQITVVQPAHEQVQQLLGMMRHPLQILALLLIGAALVSEALTSLLAAQFNRILAPLSGVSSSLEMPRLQTTRIRELNRIVAVLNRQGRTVNRLSRALQASNERLRLSEQQHRLLADNALDVICIADLEGHTTYISPSIEKVRGWSVAEALALPMEQQFTPEGCQFLREKLQAMQTARQQGATLPQFRAELQQSHKNGGWIWTDLTSSPMLDEAGTYIGTLVVYRDISERKQLEADLRQRATIDELTGLLSRRELLSRLELLLAQPQGQRQGDALALLFCDLDLFKPINDSLGHAAGDAVLKAVAERVQAQIRADDLAARMGGDELVVVLQGVDDLEAALAVARKISAAIAQPICGEHFNTALTASIGVTLARPGEEVDALIARADIAMYQAKQAGRSRVVTIR